MPIGTKNSSRSTSPGLIGKPDTNTGPADLFCSVPLVIVN